MKVSREKIIGIVVMMIAFFSITSALDVKASFLKELFTNEEEQDRSIFDISGLDSDSDGLSDSKEFDLGTNPYSSDSDDDGYSDAEEVKAGYDPLKQEGNNLIDEDGDGLTGEDEKKYHTNPNKADSDYDGYSDGMEIITGHNPLQADYSFLEPVMENTEEVIKKNEEECEGEDCDIVAENDSPVNSESTPDSIEKLLNVQNFSDVNTDSLSSIGIDPYKMSLDKSVSLSEVEDSKIKTIDNLSQEYIQIYFNIIGIALYSNSPVHSVDEAEAYAANINIVNPGEVKEMKNIVTSIKIDFEKTEVPNKSEFIDFHKKIIGAATTLESLLNSLESINSNNSDSFYSLVNLLPKFSGLNDLIFDDIYPEAQRLAEENGAKLPNKDFLEQYR